MTIHNYPITSPPMPQMRKTPRLKLGLVSLLAVLALVAMSNCAASDSTNMPSDDAAVAAPQRGAGMDYVIGPADLLSISIWNHKDLNQAVTVRPDGKLSFPLVGEVQAAGRTPAQLQLAMEQALGAFIEVIPGEVSIVVDEVHSYKVTVLGEVRAPGRFEFQSQASVLDALALAGGPTEFASTSKIQILRTVQGQQEKIAFNYKKFIKRGNTDSPALVYPGDIVLVP